MPLDLTRIKSVLGIRVIDRRWCIPFTFYRDGAQVGQAELYRLQEPHAGGVGSTIGYIHESRLVTYPGARTETLEKVRLKGWDHSVLIKPYEALRSAGQTWKAIEILVSDANQGVLSIEGLWEMIAADTEQGEQSAGNPTGGGQLQTRAKLFDQTRSVSRLVLLDKERETFERKPTQFAGLPDLSDRSWNRVAASSDIPVQLLVGEAPAGLNATGDVTLRWFFSGVSQEQTQVDEPRLLKILRILFAADDAPELKAVESDNGGETPDPFDALGLVWLPLWAPTAQELATIRLQRAQEAALWITNQVFRPEEIAMSLPEDWIPFDRELRQQILEDDHETLMAQQVAKEKAANEAAIAGSVAAKDLAENPPEPDPAGAAPGTKPGKAAARDKPGAPPPNDSNDTSRETTGKISKKPPAKKKGPAK
jgi:phage-related protein (TIGR01555 family)